MSKRSKIIYFFVSFIFFTLANLYFSELILANTALLPENDILDLIFIQNQGAAFNILHGSKTFLISFSAVAVLAIIVYIIRHIQVFSTIAVLFTALLCSGIFTNMMERIIFGFVRDYIKLNFVDFPVFNISDIFINLGVFVIVIIIIKNSYFRNNENNN